MARHRLLYLAVPGAAVAALALTSALMLAPAYGVHAAVPAGRTRVTVHVTIQNFAFSPRTLTVAPGTTVVWTNQDSAAHTVTSDTGAWTDSGNLAQGKSYSLTLTKSGSYAYHCAIHPGMIATITVSGSGASGSSGSGGSGGAGMNGMSAMGPRSMATMPVFTGYYDGHTLLYLSTDTSSSAEAMRDHIAYAPALAQALPNANKIYLVTNGAFVAHGPAFGSEPGEKDYTPLWQEVRVTWKHPSQAVALTSDNQINGLAQKGKLTLTPTGVVLNCPIIKVMAH